MRRAPLLAALLCLAAFVVPAAAVDSSTSTATSPVTNEQIAALQAAWTSPNFQATWAAMSDTDKAQFIARTQSVLSQAVAGRRTDAIPENLRPHWAALTAILNGDGMGNIIRNKPDLGILLWNALRSPSDAQLVGLLNAFQSARGTNASLTMASFLNGLTPEEVTRILTGDQVTPGNGDTNAPPTTPGTPRRPPGDVLSSVGFEGAQAYGVPGDRHVYVDGAGNIISLSISSRRAPDGSIEDVLHVVNLNSRSEPRGATFSLRTDMAALAAGTEVSIGGLKFKLKLTATGDDHKIDIAGANGPFLNNKPTREPPMSLSQLYAYRAARVFNYGRVVKVGDKEYYVAPETYTQLEGQGDAAKFVGYGQFAYWPKDEMDRLFAARQGRDEVDPQTFDFKTLDLNGSKFGNVRAMRPDLVATVIRREGIQDVAAPRASMGQDDKGQWWDAVLRNGKYVVEKGQAPAPPGQPGGPQAPAGEIPPEGLSLADGRRFVPDGPAAAALNAALANTPLAQRIRFLESSTGAAGQTLLITIGNRTDNMGFPQYMEVSGGGTGGNTLSQEIVSSNGTYYLRTRSNAGFVYHNLQTIAAPGGVITQGLSGSYKPNGGPNAIQRVNDPVAMELILAQAGYSAAAIAQVRTSLASLPTGWAISGTGFSGTPYLKAVAGNNCYNVYPTFAQLPNCEAGSGGPAGSGFRFDSAGSGNTVDSWDAAPDVGGQRLTVVPGQPTLANGAAGARLYQSVEGTRTKYYLMYTAGAGTDMRRFGPVYVFDSGSPDRYPLPDAAARRISAVPVTGALPTDLYQGGWTSPDGRSGYVGLFTRAPAVRFDRVVGIALTWGPMFPTAQSAVDHANNNRTGP